MTNTIEKTDGCGKATATKNIKESKPMGKPLPAVEIKRKQTLGKKTKSAREVITSQRLGL